MPTKKSPHARFDRLLPDFCSTLRVAEVLLLCEAVAVVLALAGGGDMGAMLWRLLLLSVYLQWIGVCSAAVLCLVGRYGAGRLSSPALLVGCHVALLVVTLLLAELAFAIGPYTWMTPRTADVAHAGFVLRSVGICAVVSALALRYFWLRASWLADVRAEASARLEALQARIRPHFLFNSLNSIASLIATRPHAAEKATEDLATLLRARLRPEAPGMVQLADELALVEAYLRVEQLRLGERLALDWAIAPQTRACPIPALSLQPLIENAIVHGIARRPDGGTLSISAQINGGQLWLRISNPIGDDGNDSGGRGQGNRQALRNIEQRLALRYADRARLLTMQQEDRFIVDLIMPPRLSGT